jgi:hypothetical protein
MAGEAEAADVVCVEAYATCHHPLSPASFPTAPSEHSSVVYPT